MRYLLCLSLILLAAATPQGLTVSKPWMRYLLPSIPAGGYLTLTNSSDTPAILTSASSPACGMLMLHETQDMSGMSAMMSVSSVTVPAHGSVTFAPGGYHLMCMSPAMKPGTQVVVTLNFQDGSSLKLAVPVYGADSSP